jgi:hypothetical protein
MTIQAAADNFVNWLSMKGITSDINDELLLMYLNDYDMGGFAGGAFSLFPNKDRYFVNAINVGRNDYGFYYIQTYEDLCLLADELHKRGYENIGKTPPSKALYEFEVNEAERLEKQYKWNRSMPITEETVSNKPITDEPVSKMKITYSK